MAIQISQDLPHPNDNSALDLNNLQDVIIYIVIPLIIIILYILWRRSKK
ncbi:adenylosuccinate synthetase [Leeuwenhoekiella sp. A16]